MVNIVLFQSLKFEFQAANPPPDINVDELLKTLSAYQGVKGYVIFNIDGIPLKRSEKTISAEKAVQYAALITDLWMVARKIIKTELKNQPTDVRNNKFTFPIGKRHCKCCTGMERYSSWRGDYRGSLQYSRHSKRKPSPQIQWRGFSFLQQGKDQA